MSKQYEPSIEGHYEKCCDEREALQMQLEEYKEAFEFARKEFHETLDDLAKMQEERDEARREAATFYARQFYKEDAVDRMSRIYAEECGWDCFLKEDEK